MPTNKINIKSPTQMKAIITSEHNDNEEILLHGVPTELGKIKELYNTAHSNKVLLEYFGRRDLIFDFPNAMDALHQSIELQEITVELRSFLLYAEASLGAAQARTQMLELFSLDETGNQKFPLIGPQTAQKFTELFLSYFSNKTLNERSPGHAYSTVSGKGMNIIRKVYTLNEDGTPDRSEIIRTDEWEAIAMASRPELAKESFDFIDSETGKVDDTVQEFSGLKEELKKAKKKGKDHIYIVDRLRHNMKLYKANGKWEGGRYSEMMAPAHFKEVIDKIIVSRKYRSPDDIEQEFLEYITTSNWSRTAQENIVRIDIKNFDTQRGRAEFANAKGYYYNKRDDAFEEYGNKKFLKIPEAIAKQFSVRIPSQDKHSAVNVMLVDFLPVFYGSSAVFPDELIEQTGWDFDIDQVYTDIKEFYTVHDNFFEFGKAATEEGKYAEYIRYMVAESNKTGSTLNEAIEQFNTLNPVDKKGRDIGQEGIIDQFFDRKEIEKIIGPPPPLDASQIQKDDYAENYKELFIESLLSFAQKETKALLRLWGKQVKEKNRGSIMGGMELLHLPITFDDYQAYKEKNKREPYAGAINNDILDYKFALLSSKGMTEKQHGRDVPAAHEPATVGPLDDLWQEIRKDAPTYAKTVDEQGYFTDSLLGKVKAWMANKSDVNIGAVVLPNVVMNLLNQERIKIRSKVVAGVQKIPQITLNGVHYNNFGVNYEIDSDPFSPTYKQQKKETGLRTHFVISALVSAAVDNPNERLISKLGLNRDALAVVTNMVALGVNLKTAVYLILQPTIRHFYFLAQNKENPFDWGIAALLKGHVKDIYKEFGKTLEKEEYDYKVSVSDNLLLKKLQKGKITRFTKEAKIAGDYTIEDAKEELEIIEQFLAAHNIKTFTGNIQSIVTLNNGFGRDTQAIDDREISIGRLGLELVGKEFDKAEDAFGNPIYFPMDIRPVFKDGKTWQGVYYDVWREFVYQLLPSVLLTRTPDFLHLKAVMLENLTKDGRYMSATQMAKIEKDLTSYLTIKAYKHSLVGSPLAESLQNGLIYDQAQGLLTIEDVVEKTKTYLDTAGPIDPKTGKGTQKYNFYIHEWSVLNPTTDLDNFSGVNQVNNNTWTGSDENSMQYVQNSFSELYSDPMTREAAFHFVHYEMVKSGLQYRANTIMDAIPPYILDRFLWQAQHVHNVFKLQKTTDPAMRSVFGITMNELKNEFLENYGQAIGSAFLLPTMQKFGKGALIYNPPVNVASVKTTGYDTLAVESDVNSIYIFGEHIAKMNGSSKEGGGPQDQRSIRTAPNSIGIPIKMNSDTEAAGFMTDENLQTKQDLVMSLIEEIHDSGKNVIFPKFLLEKAEVVAMMKYSPNYFKFLSQTLNREFGYKLYSGGKVKAKKTSTAALKNAVYIDESQEVNTLIIDQFTGIASTQRISGRERKAFRPGKKEALAQNAKLRANDDYIKKFGFKGRVTIRYDEIGQAIDEVAFPMIIKVNMTSWWDMQYNNKRAKYRYFRLNKLYMNREARIDEDLIRMLGPNELIAHGNKAEYVEFNPVGSNQQWAGGFEFDVTVFQRPTYKDVRASVKAQHDLKAGIVINMNLTDPMAALARMEKGGAASAQTMEEDKKKQNISSAKKVEVTEEEVTVDGKNADNLKQDEPTEAASAIIPPEQLAQVGVDINQFKKALGMDVSTNTYQKIMDWYDKLTEADKIKLEGEDGIGVRGRMNTINSYKQDVQKVPTMTQEEWIEDINQCVLGK